MPGTSTIGCFSPRFRVKIGKYMEVEIRENAIREGIRVNNPASIIIRDPDGHAARVIWFPSDQVMITTSRNEPDFMENLKTLGIQPHIEQR